MFLKLSIRFRIYHNFIMIYISKKTQSLYKSNRICVCVFNCLSVPKDLCNRWNDMVLLYSVPSHRSWENL